MQSLPKIAIVILISIVAVGMNLMSVLFRTLSLEGRFRSGDFEMGESCSRISN